MSDMDIDGILLSTVTLERNVAVFSLLIQRCSNSKELRDIDAEAK